MSAAAMVAVAAVVLAVVAAVAAAAAGTPHRWRLRLCCCTARRPRWPAAARCTSRHSLSQTPILKPSLSLTPQLSHSNQVHRLPLSHLPSSRLPSSNEPLARPHFSPQLQPTREVTPAASVRGEHPLPPPRLSAFAARSSTGAGAPTASRIAVRRSGATPRSLAGPSDDKPFADTTAPPPPLARRPAAAVAAAPASVRKPPPDRALFSDARGNPFAAGVEPQATEAAQLFGLPRRPASSTPISREGSATDWQFIPQPLAGVGGAFDGDDGCGYGGVGGGDESGRGYRGVLPPAREDGTIGGSLRGLNRSARCDHEIGEIGEVGGMGGGPWPASMPRGSSSSSSVASTAAERARPLASRGTAPSLPPHSADWLAAKSALPSFDNEGARVASTGSSNLFSLVGGGRAHNSPRRLNAPPPPLAAAPSPLRRHPEASGDTGPRGGFVAASARGAAGRGVVAARGAAAAAASGNGQGLQQFSAGVDAWFSSATSSKRKKAQRLLPSPSPSPSPHPHPSHIPNPSPGGTRARLRLARPAPAPSNTRCAGRFRSADDQAT